MKPKVMTALVLVGCAAALAVWWATSGRSPEPPIEEIGLRIPELRRLVDEEQKRAVTVVGDYMRTTPGRIDDLSCSAEDILRQLPGVVEVEVQRLSKSPTHRLIHLRDWHFVPKELFALDMKAAYQRPLSEHEIDLLVEEHLLEVERVQIEQMTLLRCLIKHHGLRRVFAEGFSEKELAVYQAKVAALRGVETESIPRLHEQLAEVRAFLGRTNEGEERHTKAKSIEAEILSLLDQHWVALLEVGSAGRLLISRELEEVLPIEDAEKLEEAKPVTPSGEIKLDPAKVDARRDAQVRNALKHGPFALVVLGGAHDVSANARRLTDGRCECIRVTTWKFKELLGR